MDIKLYGLREKIDAIDNEILALLNKRMGLVKEVGHLKRSSNAVIYRPEREKAILDRLNQLNEDQNGLLNDKIIESVFLEIFAASRNFELPERIAYLGPEGSFTHQAAESRFGAVSDYVALSSIQSVFESVATGRVRFGVVPIENNREGTVHETVDLLISTDVKVVAEIPLNIHFTFASREDRLQNITRIYSKDIAFRQCKKFLDEYFPNNEQVQFIPVESTSKAAKLAATEDGSAAICAGVAAKINQLPILFDNIEDSATNRTRFFIISKDIVNQMSKGSKTSIVAKVADEAGSLAVFLQDFYKANINLCKIDSRPSKQDERFKYWFLIDFDGHYQEEHIAEILHKNREYVKWLGSYVKLC